MALILSGIAQRQLPFGDLAQALVSSEIVSHGKVERRWPTQVLWQEPSKGANVEDLREATTQKASVICAYPSKPAGELVNAKGTVPASAV
jgi:hypothetical protein